MNDEINIKVLGEAKDEYTKQLCMYLRPCMIQGFDSIFQDSRDSVLDKNKSYRVFQENLRKIPKWNQEVINDEVERIIKSSKCNWLEELITAVFITHAKILSSVRLCGESDKINIVIPRLDNFIHKCYIESARSFYKNPLLFRTNNLYVEKQEDIYNKESIIDKCISEVIRKTLPVSTILKEYLPSKVDDVKIGNVNTSLESS